MADKLNEIKARFEFFDLKYKGYKKLIDLLEGRMTPELETLTQTINEKFTSGIYLEAKKIATQAEALPQLLEKKQIPFNVYWEQIGDLPSRMLDLSVNYDMFVDSNMTKLKKEVDIAIETMNIPKEIAHEISETFDQLNINEYYTKSHAVIIGINDYQNENVLKNAVNDAKAVRNILVEKLEFENIIEYYDEDANRQNIRYILEDQLQKEEVIGNNDRVLVYFSGHGKLRETGTGEDGKPIKRGYLIPVDAQKKMWSSCIKMDDVVQACRDCAAKHVLLVLDCCYAGAASRGAGDREEIGDKTLQQYVTVLTNKRAIQIIAAGQDDEEVSDDSIIKGHSTFTAAFLEVLEDDRDTDNDGLLTGNEVGGRVRSKVLGYLGVDASLSQTPTFGSLAGGIGEFVFKIFPTKKKT